MTGTANEMDVRYLYAGLSYQRASLEAARLIERAHRSGLWAKDLPERLLVLRGIMERQARRAA